MGNNWAEYSHENYYSNEYQACKSSSVFSESAPSNTPLAYALAQLLLLSLRIEFIVVHHNGQSHSKLFNSDSGVYVCVCYVSY